MNARRLNITLPKRLVDRLKSVPNKSRFIAEALEEKWNADEAARLEEALAEAYRARTEEDRELTADWDVVSGDGL